MKISVIIPAYNAEKYLGVCLESILIQTLQDYEVIVVDDCSTDNSATVAENYLERFGGRLKIISLPENTGGGALPRNVGFEYAQGKYIFFIDPDDLLIDTALETLYNVSENYQADVVYMEKYFTCGEEIIPTKINLSAWCYADSFVEEPTLATKNISERIQKFLASKIFWTPSKFSRRDFLLDNDIKFPRMNIAEDVCWTFKVICLAENFLQIPTPLCIIRTNENSVTRTKRTPEQMIKLRTSPLITGLDYLDEFMRGLEFFKKNPVIRLQVLNFFMLLQIDNMTDALKEFEPTELYEIFLREFSKAGSSQPALISYLLMMTNLYRNELRALT